MERKHTSREALKTYLDFVHLIETPKMSLNLILKVLRFLHFEDLTLEKKSDFEGRLAAVS